MSKLYSLYKNDVDKAWYDSSNVLYSECDDITDALKVLRVTFKNGRTYRYSDVNVNDYLMFRESDSQGKALNKFIKKYNAERIEDKDVNEINNTLSALMPESSNEDYAELTDDNVKIFSGGEVIGTFSLTEESPKELVKNILNSLKINVKINN